MKMNHSRVRRLAAGISICAVLFGATSPALDSALAQRKAKAEPRKLSEEQRIVHVLNRLGFGARPGDVERVRASGLEAYINQQLNPEKIDDAVADNKVKDLVALKMSTAELYEKYPQPGQLLRQLQARGVLPADATRPDAGNPGQPNQSNQPNQPNLPPPGQPNPMDNEKYREAVRAYYQENGLQQPQRIVGELQASRILRAVYSDRQLLEVMVDFWTNHFNVFAGKGADRWLLPAYDRDSIRPNAMAKFGSLLHATAESPAMLFYLDNFQSVAPNAQRARAENGGGLRPRALLALGGRGRNQDPNVRPNGQEMPQRPNVPPQQQRRGINENYARELMELHTLGVDGGYTQKDVQEVARCFTGWTIFAPRGGAAAPNARMGDAARRSAGTFFFNARVHDDGEKVVLGHKIPAGGGIKDGLMVLDILVHHPSTAKFISTKLVKHFVADNPPAALVDRVAATFTKTDGDIREMLRTVFLSPEFNSPEAYRAKIKRPFELVISAIRTLGADTNGGPGTHQWIARMGEPLYGFQTPNGYSDAAESWVNTGGLLERMNFGLALASNRVPGTRVNLRRLAGTPVQGEAVDKTKVMDSFLSTILGGDVSAATRDELLKQLDQPAVVNIPAQRAQMEPQGEMGGQMDMPGPRRQQQQRPRVEANINDPVTKTVGLILGTPEFQRQ